MPNATTSAEDKLDYILFCLAHAGAMLTESFNKVADLKKVYSGNDARKKFKRYIEECGQCILNGKNITIKDGAGVSAPATPTLKKANGAAVKKAAGKSAGLSAKVSKPVAKKRKVSKEEKEEEENYDDGVIVGYPEH